MTENERMLWAQIHGNAIPATLLAEREYFDLKDHLDSDPNRSWYDPFVSIKKTIRVDVGLALEFRGWFEVFAFEDTIVMRHRVTRVALLNPMLSEVLATLDVLSIMEDVLPRAAMDMDHFHQ